MPATLWRTSARLKIGAQIEVCCRYAERQGWSVVKPYDNGASSGSRTFARCGFLRMLADAEPGRFDVLVCEAIGRLSRKLADVTTFFDRLWFHKVAVHATSLGLVPDADAANGLRAELHGDLGVLLTLSEPEYRPRREARLGVGRLPETSVCGSLLSVVAGHDTT